MGAVEDATRYPLSWPSGWKRTPYSHRRVAPFSKRVRSLGSAWARKERLDIGDGLSRLTGELRRLGTRNVIISSNLRVRNDGLPYAQQAKQLDDPGVAVYFKLNGQPRVLACDKWTSAAENMAAIAGHIEAIRAQERYGVGSLDQAFAGYAALPPREDDPWTLLGVSRDASREDVLSAHRQLAVQHHPDRGGSTEYMARINTARDEALRVLEASR